MAASTVPAVLALKAASTSIPIVFFVAADPIALGLVESLSRPGGNLTGTTTSTLEIGSLQLQLLHEIVPTATRFALLINPTSPNLANAQTRDLQAAARSLGVGIELLRASSDSEVDAALAKAASANVGGLLIGADSFFFFRAERLAAEALRHRRPRSSAFANSPWPAA